LFVILEAIAVDLFMNHDSHFLSDAHHTLQSMSGADGERVPSP
jgi:hypothetical protein